MVRAMQMPTAVRADIRHEAARRAAARIAELNADRSDSFQDAAMEEIRLAQDAFRADTGAELPAPATDPLLDGLMHLARDLDASPDEVRRACDRLLELAGAPAR